MNKPDGKLINIIVILIFFFFFFHKIEINCDRQMDYCNTSSNIFGLAINSETTKLSNIVNFKYNTSWGRKARTQYYNFVFVDKTGLEIPTAISEDSRDSEPDRLVSIFLSFLLNTKENNFIHVEYPERPYCIFLGLLYFICLGLMIREKFKKKKNIYSDSHITTNLTGDFEKDFKKLANEQDNEEVFGKIKTENDKLYVLCPNCEMKYGVETKSDGSIEIRNFEDIDKDTDSQQIICIKCGQKFTVHILNK